MTTNTNHEARRAALFARTSTPALVAAGLMLTDKGNTRTAEECLSLHWIHDEIEQRMGGIPDDDAFAALFDDDGVETYMEALLITFPQLTGSEN